MSEHINIPADPNNPVKYQVFISSTYQDLKEERMLVSKTILMAGGIPAGMEYFSAADDEQFNIIKQVIDLCDLYVLIIGKRYGSVHPTKKISFTEMEYDYAKAKGIDVLVFALDENIDSDEYEKETATDKIEKLQIFRDKAMQGRLASVWRDKSDLAIRVTNSIRDAMLRCNRPGWIRGDARTHDALVVENAQLKTEVSTLKTKLAEFLSPVDLQQEFYGKEIQIRYYANIFMSSEEETLTTTLDELFKHISVRLQGLTQKECFGELIRNCYNYDSVGEQDAFVILAKYHYLDLVKTVRATNGKEYIQLTELGKKISYELN